MKNGNVQKGIIGLIVMLVLSGIVIYGSEPLYQAIENTKTDQTEENNVTENANKSTGKGGLNDGVYETESADYDEKGYKDTMKMVVSGGKITELVWDNVNQEGASKAQASLNGEYVMTEDGLSWAEQAGLLADYVIKTGAVSGLSMDEKGKTDAIAGVSISINGFMELAGKVLAQAGGITESKKVLQDGKYRIEALEFDEKGYKDVVDMVVSNGIITELVWDEIDENGSGKAKLSMEGAYVMTETGLTWAEQAELLAGYVIKNQTLGGLDRNDEGKIDTIAGVSISINGFVDLTERALRAAGQGNSSTVALKDGSYLAEGAGFDEKGYKDQVKMTVKDGKITALTWDNIDQDGNGKLKLSMEGEYVMTETGLTWAEQSELLAKYVLEHQSLSGLNPGEDGKTDSISGVSISINGFISTVEDALKQASAE